MEYLKLILTFLAGGGLLKLSQFISNRKKTNLDYTEQYTAFLEKKGKSLLEIIKDLEDRVTDLEKNSCVRTECKIRMKSII